ncbi:DUF1599 domain-containing protein [Porphyromonas gingivalis]|uniref:DUF1599 domain-containing protein n=1 Tax=Porphyromonas gingivalis TaxID=837 RepID=UPI0003ACFA17|nr:DUF1599 domain-containing protein [Porphyromonas gingivalis]ATR91311.1 DUF1599 domain-containing protein [Porphyromonas gingivalis]ERJ71498.1 hypothetical protein HMPREF1554_00111 [Porphyromonas gingivalis F0569]ERJ83384.1 hypothetical protein HMPREF1988_01179 [Porphyromonas gingivalis F0185]ERJ85577.1 hypothetical protein HMPREF1989_01603 [Porphyromonas gingivalis F0566]OWR78641.1 hypothetical protein SJDPG11_06345 [Porphyromonas gingivalis SJD11]
MITAKPNTVEQFEHVIDICREVFQKKLHDYGASWRVMRPSSLTDQLYIKANRIRNIQMKGLSKVDEGVESEFIGVVNYGVIALIQLELGVADTPKMETEEALRLYDLKIREAMSLMLDKNHDYGEAWRQMRVSSFADLILTKVFRTKEIEDLGGDTYISEGVDANYMDMINYAIFALIQLNG